MDVLAVEKGQLYRLLTACFLHNSSQATRCSNDSMADKAGVP